jgi:hypothetical protein
LNGLNIQYACIYYMCFLSYYIYSVALAIYYNLEQLRRHRGCVCVCVCVCVLRSTIIKKQQRETDTHYDIYIHPVPDIIKSSPR